MHIRQGDTANTQRRRALRQGSRSSAADVEHFSSAIRDVDSVRSTILRCRLVQSRFIQRKAAAYCRRVGTLWGADTFRVTVTVCGLLSIPAVADDTVIASVCLPTDRRAQSTLTVMLPAALPVVGDRFNHDCPLAALQLSSVTLAELIPKV